MGESYEATCRECSHAFAASDGGGFLFYEVHCVTCGRSQSVAHDLIPDATEEYRRAADEAVEATGQPLKALAAGTVSLDREAAMRWARAMAAAAARLDDAIERAAGRCTCGGRFGLHAAVRCPVCKSTKIDKGPTLFVYD